MDLHNLRSHSAEIFEKECQKLRAEFETKEVDVRRALKSRLARLKVQHRRRKNLLHPRSSTSVVKIGKLSQRREARKSEKVKSRLKKKLE